MRVDTTKYDDAILGNVPSEAACYDTDPKAHEVIDRRLPCKYIYVHIVHAALFTRDRVAHDICA